ncbi:MAG: formate dehydrogenase accessory sulfurtransferase FdhD [Syntrophales bacterium]|jgi:FdhD protein
MNSGLSKSDVVIRTVLSYDGYALKSEPDAIIREVPLRILLNSHQVVTLACTGSHIDELAVGWLQSEGLIRYKNDLIDIQKDEEKVTVSVMIQKPIEPPKVENVAVASSGSRSITGQMIRTPLCESPVHLTLSNVQHLMDSFLEQCRLHDETGGTHGAALARPEELIVVREDIGRHNAIDMLGGYALLKGLDCKNMVIVRTGRVYTEIVQKVWTLGVPILISISVPTTSAIREAETAGITLVGSVRRGRMKIYTHERRIHL